MAFEEVTKVFNKYSSGQIVHFGIGLIWNILNYG